MSEEKLITLDQAAELLGVPRYELLALSRKRVKGSPKRVKNAPGKAALYREADFLVFSKTMERTNDGFSNRLAMQFLTGKLGVRYDIN